MNDSSEFKAWFKGFNSWNMSYDDLLSASFTPGKDPGDIVATSEAGHVMTRYMCNYWIIFYQSSLTGWNARNEDEQSKNGNIS